MTIKNYEVFVFTPENPFHLAQWLQQKLDEDNLRLIGFSERYYVFESINLLVSGNGFAQDALSSYSEFYDAVMVALGYSGKELPSQEMDNKMLEKISDLFKIVRSLSSALYATYEKLPAHWKNELPFSYHSLMREVKWLINADVTDSRPSDCEYK